MSFKDPKVLIHKDMVKSLEEMISAADSDGIDLKILSSYRSYTQQENIWNEKAKGKRAVYADDGSTLDPTKLDAKTLLFSILRWSAVPGASRHHWGSDLDVYDQNAMTAGYRIKLSPDEYAVSGIFSKLSQWLEENMSYYGFFRPYSNDLGGVHPEAWHISYSPLASRYLAAFSEEYFYSIISNSALELKAEILENLTTIYEKYVVNISKPAF